MGHRITSDPTTAAILPDTNVLDYAVPQPPQEDWQPRQTLSYKVDHSDQAGQKGRGGLLLLILLTVRR